MNVNRNFVLFLGLIFLSNITASLSTPKNPFMYEMEIGTRKYSFLNHKHIISYEETVSQNLSGKGRKILVIDVSPAHTSQVTSLINDRDCGIAPGAEVISRQTIYYSGIIEDSLPVIIKEGCAEKVNFISISFCDRLRKFPESWKEAFLEAKNMGIGILMSAGNDGKSIDKMYCGIDAFLKKMDRSFLFVSASGYKNKSEMRAEMSNYPSGNCDSYCITAPGDNILSKRFGAYEYFGGTSAATPIVAAGAALVQEANPDLTSQDVLNILFQSARKTRLSIDRQKEDHAIMRILDLKAALAETYLNNNKLSQER